MKLYVVGPDSGDPDEWSVWSEPAIVIAETPEQAANLVLHGGPVHEVDMTKPRLLMQMPEPAWGEDL